jgi:hypothetical protein
MRRAVNLTPSFSFLRIQLNDYACENRQLTFGAVATKLLGPNPFKNTPNGRKFRSECEKFFDRERLPYDRKKYAAMLREAFEPFVQCLPETAEENLFTDSLTEQELKMFPLLIPLALLRPLKV